MEIFNYNGQDITFDFGNSAKMVNATQMAKPFPSKRPNDFMRLNATKEFIELLETRYGDSRSGVVKVVNGGTKFGTWMCEELALEFAGWLSPSFKLWMNDKIRELLTTGKTELPTVQQDDDDIILLAMQTLQKRIEAKNEVIKELKPKADYTDKVLTSSSTYKTTQIAKEFGISAIKLNKLLHAYGVQYKINGQWVLYADYADNGYTDTETTSYQISDTEIGTRQQTVWTESGRKFIHHILKNKSNAN